MKNSAYPKRSAAPLSATVGLTIVVFYAPAFAFVQTSLSVALANQSGSTSVAKTPRPDFSGFWELSYNSRHITPAKLTPQAIERDKQAVADREAGKVVVYASRWCNYLGMPFIMGQSPPINLVQTRDEIAIFSEQNSAPRHIYLDGRSHPDPSGFVPTTNGHSVGHWEGDELVVDTTNFSAKGHPEIPGGGYRGRGSHLVERFKILDAGKSLSVTFTWDDTAVFLEPHTYNFIFHKMPPETFAYEDVCDASDAAPYENSGGVTDAPDK